MNLENERNREHEVWLLAYKLTHRQDKGIATAKGAAIEAEIALKNYRKAMQEETDSSPS